MRMTLGGVIGVGLVLGMVWVGAGAGGAAPQGAEGRMAKMVEGLGSADFLVREAAQKELDGMGWERRGELANLAGRTTDAEVKARLGARVEAIDEEMAVMPAGISVSLKGATVVEVEAALAQATGSEIGVPGAATRLSPEDLFTLEAKGEPFWKVMNALSRQHALLIRHSVSGWSLRTSFTERPEGVRSVGGYAKDIQSAGGFGYWQNGPVEMVAGIVLGAPGAGGGAGGGGQYQMLFSMAADPRMHVVGLGFPVWREVVDDKENRLVVRRTSGTGSMMAVRSGVWVRAVTLDVPANPGKKIEVMKGEIKAVVGWGEERLEVAEPGKRVGETIAFGQARVTVERFSVTDKQKYKEALMTLKVEWPTGVQAVPITGTIVEADGKALWQGVFLAGSSGGGAGAVLTEPLKLRLTMVGKTKGVVVPVEFKGVALP